MRKLIVAGAIAAVGALSASAHAADFTLELTEGGANEVVANIEWTDSAPSVSTVAIDISHPAGWAVDASGCPDNVPATHGLSSCQSISGTVVRWTLVDFTNANALPTGNYGTIVFSNVTETFDEATLLPLVNLSVEDARPVGGGANDPSLVNTSVEVVTGPSPDISLTGNGAFGGVEAGSSATSTFTVENSGDPATTLEINSIDVTGDAEFSQSGGTCTTSTTLATGATCTVIVEFAPGVTGNFTGDLAVGSNAGTENIALTGQGTAAQPVLNTTSTSLVLQGAEEGQSVSGSFTVSNNGPAATEIVISNCSIDTDPSGTAAINPAGATLAGGDAQQFTVSADSPAVGTSFTVEYSCDFEEFDSDGTSIGTGTIDGSANVSTRAAVIPTLSSVGMILFAMLMGLVGLVVVRQRA